MIGIRRLPTVDSLLRAPSRCSIRKIYSLANWSGFTRFGGQEAFSGRSSSPVSTEDRTQKPSIV